MSDSKYTAVMQWPVENVPYAYSQVTVRADTVEEFSHALKAANGVALDVYLAQETLRAGIVGGELVGTEMVPEANPHRQAVQQPSQPAPSGPATQSQAPSCAHGARKLMSGTSRSGQQWSGWFCALPKGSPGACVPLGTDGRPWGQR